MQTNKKALIRQKEIAEYISLKGAATLSELCKKFSSSEATIRNDLTKLEKDGLIKRILGGAISNEDNVRNTVLATRMNRNNAEKKQIAEYIAENIIKPGMTITLDSGTSTLYLAKEIAARRIPCTVITNSFQAAQALIKSSDVRICLCGGWYDPDHGSFHDEMSESVMNTYFSEICFLSPNGIDTNGLITNSGISENSIKMKMINRSHRVIVLADHSKLNKTELKVLCTSNEIESVITDSSADSNLITKLQQAGFNIIQA